MAFDITKTTIGKVQGVGNFDITKTQLSTAKTKEYVEKHSAVGFDTFERDLVETANIIKKAGAGWQDKATMKSAKKKIEDVKKRIDAFEKWRKQYATNTESMRETQKAYADIISNWDNLSKEYGDFASEEEYQKAVKDAETVASNNNKPLEEYDAEIKVLKEQVKKAEELQDKYLFGIGAQGSQFSFNTGEKEKNDLDKYLGSIGYNDIDELKEKEGTTIANRKNAERYQALNKMVGAIKEKGDFKQKSSHDSALSKSENYDADAFDVLYDRINQEGWYGKHPDTPHPKHGSVVPLPVFDEDGKMVYGSGDYYHQMEDEEIKAFNYFYNTNQKEKAKKYLGTLYPTLENREAADFFKNYLKDNGFLEVLYSIPSGLKQFGEGVKNNFNFSDDYIEPSFTAKVGSLAREDLGDGFGGFVYDTLNTISNMAPSILLGKLTGSGWVGAGAMGFSARGNAYASAINSGMDKSQAHVYSTLVGVSETMLSRLLSGVSSLGGSLTGKTIQAAVSGIESGFWRFAANLGIRLSSEAIEEMSQEILEPLFENIALGYTKNGFEDIDWSQVAYVGLMTLVTTGILEGGSTYRQTKAQTKEFKTAKRNFPDTESQGYLIQEGVDLGGKAKELATKLKAKIDGGKELKGSQIANLIKANETEIKNGDVSKIKAAVSSRLIELGETENVSDVADAITKQATGTKLSAQEKAIIKKSKYGQRVSNEANPQNAFTEEFSNYWAQLIETDIVNAEAYNNAVNNDSGVENLNRLERRIVETDDADLSLGERMFKQQMVARLQNRRNFRTKGAFAPNKEAAQGENILATPEGDETVDERELGFTEPNEIEIRRPLTYEEQIDEISGRKKTAQMRHILDLAKKLDRDLHVEWIPRTDARLNGQKGKYIHDIKVLYLASDLSTVEAYAEVFKHEFVHRLETKKAYQGFKNYLLNKSEAFEEYAISRLKEHDGVTRDNRQKAVDDLITMYIDNFKKNTAIPKNIRDNFTKEKAEKEAVADFVARTLFKGNTAQLRVALKTNMAALQAVETDLKLFEELARDDRKLFKKIIDAIKDFIASIKGIPQFKTLEQDLNYIEQRLSRVYNSADKSGGYVSDLYVTHNTTEKLLHDILQDDAILMPSTAITNQGVSDFGDYTVVYDKASIDPSANKSNKLYGSDAWTPTQPTLKINPHFDLAKTREVVDSIKNTIGEEHVTELFNVSEKGFKKEIAQKDGSIYGAYSENIGMQTAYALEKGLIQEIPVKAGKVDFKLLEEQVGKSLDTDEGWRQYKRWLYKMSDEVIDNYDKATLEKIFETMESQPETAKKFKLSSSGELVVPAVKYSSVQELRENKGRLSSNAEADTKAVANRLMDFATRVSTSAGVDISKAVETINQGFDNRYQVNDIISLFSRKGFEMSTEQAMELQELYKDAVELSTLYFEGKPHRQVGLDEIKAIVAPDNISRELQTALEEKGIRVVKYKTGNEQSRFDAIHSIEDVSFSADIKNTATDSGVVYQDAEFFADELNEDLNQEGLEYDEESESAFSADSWEDSAYVKDRDATAKKLADALGISKQKALDYIKDIDGIANTILADYARLGYVPSPDRSAFVSNAEYGGSIDMSTLCAKRRWLTGTFSAIQKALNHTALTANEILEIRNMLKAKGVEVSCGLCYVEGSRAQMGKFAKEFIERYKKRNPDWIPDMADVNTPEGVEQMRLNHPDAYEAYEQFWNNKGVLNEGEKNLFASQQKPKLYQLRTDYKHEILDKFSSEGNVVEKNKNGGMRIQSFSDFEIVHLIDMMQVIIDMSQVGLHGQAYTKVPEFALALGNTGLKINLSLIAKDVDANGNLVFDDVEGMPFETAMNIRNMYSKNVGTVLVVFNDAQLKAALKDSRIDFVLPFHRSQWKKAMYADLGLPSTTKDYTYVQNERYIKPVYYTTRNGTIGKRKATNYMPNEYWDFSKSGKENAENYLKMCAENNKRPKFYKLLVDNGDGSYSLQPDGSTDGYWKLLIDFKMYDNEGKGSKQTSVKPDFNMDECYKMLENYEGGHEKFPVNQEVVDEFVGKYMKEHGEKGFKEKTKSDANAPTSKYDFSFSADDIAKYTEEQYNNFGWVRYNDVLTPHEYTTLLSRYADYKHNKDFYPTTKFKEAVIYSFDLTNIVMYVKGTIKNPHITKIIKINNTIPSVIQRDIQKEALENEKRGLYSPWENVELIFGKESFSTYKARDFETFQQYERSKKRGDGIADDSVDSKSQDRTGVDRKRTNVKNISDSSYSSDDLTVTHRDLLDRYEQGEITKDEYLAEMDGLYGQAVEQYGAIEKGEYNETDIPVPQAVAEDKPTKRFARTFVGAAKLTPKMVNEFEKDMLLGKFSYKVASDDKAIETAKKVVSEGEGEKVWESLLHEGGFPTKNDIAIGEKLLTDAIEEGDTLKIMQLTSELADIFTRAGQLVQAASLLGKMTGAGRLVGAQRFVDSLNTDIRKKHGVDARTIKIDPKLAELLATAEGQRAIEQAYREIMKNVAEQMPPTFLDKWNAWRYFAMLCNPRTHVRNLVGNTIFIPSVRLKDTIAAGLEKALKVENGTKVFKVKKEYREFAKNDVKKKETQAILKGGKYDDAKNEVNKNRKTFETKWLEGATSFVFNALETEDMWFKTPHYVHALGSFLQARKVDLSNVSEKVLTEAREYAVKEAKKATFNDANKIATDIQKFSDKSMLAKLAVEGILPFKRTPLNIIRRGVEYSPIGFVTTLAKSLQGIKNGEYSATEAIDGYASAATGTILMGLGWLFASLGWASGGDDDEDKDWYERLLGGQNYAITIGDHSYTIDWSAPSAIPFFMGVEISSLAEEGFKWGSIVDVMGSSLEPLINLSALQGVQDAINSTRYADEDVFTSLLLNTAQSYAMQNIPSFIGASARTVDSKQRSWYVDKNSDVPKFAQDMWNEFRSKIPGLSQTMPEKVDAWGREVSRGSVGERIFENAVSPGYYSKKNYTDVDRELEKLYDKTKEAKVLPKTAPKYFAVDGKKKYLTADEYVTFAKAKGQYSFEYVEEFINHREYDKLTDEQKAEVISDLYEYAGAKAKTKVSKFDIMKTYKTVTLRERNGGSAVDYYIVQQRKK